MVPSIAYCFSLMEAYHMLDNIKEHSLVVAKVARIITRGVREAGANVSLKKVTAAALLHDIGKTKSLTSGEDHSRLGGEICQENHLEEIVDIVKEHVILKKFEIDGMPSEKEIVFYADKRVNHDRIVPLNERLAYIIRRYGGNHEDRCMRIEQNFKLCAQVEKKLFMMLKFRPESLAEMVEEEAIVLHKAQEEYH